MFHYLRQLDSLIAAMVSYVDELPSSDTGCHPIDEKLTLVKMALV